MLSAKLVVVTTEIPDWLQLYKQYLTMNAFRLVRSRSKSEPALATSGENLSIYTELPVTTIQSEEPRGDERNTTSLDKTRQKSFRKNRFSLILPKFLKSKDSESEDAHDIPKRESVSSTTGTDSKSSDIWMLKRGRTLSKASSHSTDSKSSKSSSVFKQKDLKSIETCKASENDVQTVQSIRRGSLKELGEALSSSFTGISEDKKLRRASRQIDKELEQDFLKMIGSKMIKVAILGSGNSGKSTLIRQMKILNRILFTDDERYNSIVSIHGNIVAAISLLLKACFDNKDLKVRFDIEDDSDVSLFLKDFVIGKDFIPETLKESLIMIWNNSLIQECFKYKSVRSRMQDTAI